jgi:hypothetical protein
MACALVGTRLYVFGGLGAGPVDETWMFDLAAMRWTPLRNTVAVPPARCAHTLTADPDGNIWLYGGQAGSKGPVDLKKDSATSLRVRMLDKRNCCEDTWMFDPNGNGGKGKWHEQFCQVSPSPRRGHSATLVLGRKSAYKLSSSDEDEEGADEGPVSLLASLESEMKAREKAAQLAKNPPAHEIFVIGGAGPDPGKGFETVWGTLWIFNLRKREWTDNSAKCSGLLTQEWARFEHTTTLVQGGVQGASAKDTLVMVGGVSASTMDMNTESSTAVPNYNWGGPEDTVLALDVETLTWTKMMTVSPFKEESLLRSQTLGDEEDIIKAPALHGHTTVPNPCNPRELLIFGGRGGQQWTNELYSLTLPAEHMPGLPYPGMPKKKVKANVPIGGFGLSRNTEDDEKKEQKIPDPVITWDILGVDAEEELPLARYGHILVPWAPKVEIDLDAEKAAEEAAEAAEVEKAKVTRGSSRGSRGGGSPSRGKGTKKGGAATSSKSTAAEKSKNQRKKKEESITVDLSPTTPGLLLFGGSLFGGKAVEGYAGSEVQYLDLKMLVEAEQAGDNGVESSLSFDLLSGTSQAGGAGLSSARSLPGLRSARSQGLRSARSAGGSSSAQNLLAKLTGHLGGDLDTVGDGALPSRYFDMKKILLGQRPDHRTSKIRRGEKPRTPPPQLQLSSIGSKGSVLSSGTSMRGVKSLSSFEAFEFSRSMSLTAMLASHDNPMRRSASAPYFGKDAPVVAKSLKSTMNYAKLRKLAKEDQRYGPSSEDLERSNLMSGILKGRPYASAMCSRFCSDL